MWSIEVTDANGNRLELLYDSAQRMAFIVHHPKDGGPPVRVAIAAESFRSIAKVIAGWPL